MSQTVSQITSLTIVYSIVYSGTDQRKHQSSASLAFVWGSHRGPVNFPAQMDSNAENASIWWRHHDEANEIIKLECLSPRRAVVIAQPTEARCLVENEDVVGAAPTAMLQLYVSDQQFYCLLRCGRILEISR